MGKSLLQSELGKKHRFESLEEEAVLNMLRTHDQFDNRFLRLFRTFGVTPSQYNVLRILRGEGQPLPSLEIASRMVQVVPAITGLIDRLEKAAMVRRERSTEDRRVVRVEITKRGLKVLADIDEPLTALRNQLIGHLTRQELKELIRLMEKARAPLANDEA